MYLDHERNVLIWLVAKPWRLALLIAWMVLLSVFMGCSSSYTFADDPPRQRVASIVMNECLAINIEAEVRFEKEDRITDGGAYGYPGQTLYSAMAARVPDVVIVYPRALNLDTTRLVGYARHECCHLALGHKWTPDRTEEAEAEACIAATNWEEE